MTDKEIALLIDAELRCQRWVTEQYTKIQELVRENGLVKIARVDRESDEKITIAYLSVKDEYFFSRFILMR